jgi:hypothetical protein
MTDETVHTIKWVQMLEKKQFDKHTLVSIVGHSISQQQEPQLMRGMWDAFNMEDFCHSSTF